MGHSKMTSTEGKVRGLPKKNKGGGGGGERGSIQHSDSTNSVFYPDHLFHFSMFINRNSSCLLCYLFHDFKDYYKFANDSALNSCLYSFGLLK